MASPQRERSYSVGRAEGHGAPRSPEQLEPRLAGSVHRLTKNHLNLGCLLRLCCVFVASVETPLFFFALSSLGLLGPAETPVATRPKGEDCNPTDQGDQIRGGCGTRAGLSRSSCTKERRAAEAFILAPKSINLVLPQGQPLASKGQGPDPQLQILRKEHYTPGATASICV
ncbi:hypothetical protein P7K49_029099 [Saguinus oedipus]|uniref:Uncharacterized protein n=1 Tax=Saguinus oedipus TaxID=9490 RepID=A0ABQ9U6U4_SAGOE|nr:hypothetical protein P7K49_029099 [Saguinus oedipus]